MGLTIAVYLFGAVTLNVFLINWGGEKWEIQVNSAGRSLAGHTSS